MSSYMTMCLNGEALIDEIDDFIDEWHEGNSTQELNEFLGITEQEYGYYLADENILPYIMNAHKFNKNIDDIINAFQHNDELQFAARSSDTEKAKFLINYFNK